MRLRKQNIAQRVMQNQVWLYAVVTVLHESTSCHR